MDTEALLRDAQQAMSVRRVFGEPVEGDGYTVIPVARVRGGGGGGGGEGPDGAGEGSGAGFGLSADPVGAFLVTDGTVTWRPSVDVNRVLLGAQVVAVVALLTVRSIIRLRRGAGGSGSTTEPEDVATSPEDVATGP